MKKSSGDEEACTLPRAVARSVCVDEWVSIFNLKYKIKIN
jgi:hypothetical protein